MKEDPPPDAKCRDKFLVQSVAVPADKEAGNVAQIVRKGSDHVIYQLRSYELQWQQIEQTAKSSIEEKKIRVSFLPPDGNAPSSSSVNGLSSTSDVPPAYASSYDSPTPQATTPQRGVTPQYQSQSTPVGAVSKPESRPADNKHLGDAVRSAGNPAGNPTNESTSSSMPNVPESLEDLKAQLAEARSTISRLTSQATEGLRQRKPDISEQAPKERERNIAGQSFDLSQPPAGGVPVQIVAGLCLLCFLLAYFFF